MNASGATDGASYLMDCRGMCRDTATRNGRCQHAIRQAVQCAKVVSGLTGFLVGEDALQPASHALQSLPRLSNRKAQPPSQSFKG